MSTGQAFQQIPMQQMPMQQMPMQMPMQQMQQMMPQSSSYIDLILQYKWIIIALIAAFVYMRYFNKKPKEEEKKA
jgi:hypothetical protein